MATLESLEFEGFEKATEVEGIIVIGIVEWEKLHITEGHGYSNSNMEKFQQWCKNHNAHYYARDKSEFFQIEAIEEAKYKGMNLVVLESLS